MGIILKIAEALDNKQMRSQGKKASENSQLNNAIKTLLAIKCKIKYLILFLELLKKFFAVLVE
jgi:hypothetical protein